ncbi:MAG TPA: HD domain-containing protein, partial [Chitinophagaceae bacterium]|nr:HD domain-containing protein [Chitinophagaceae bacterium]
MDIVCTDKELFIFKKIAQAAEELSLPAYIIGGFVRDKLIGRPTKDVDIVCIGDGIELATLVAKKFNPQPAVNYFKNFGTAHIHTNELDIEFVGARKESYRDQSRKPEVELGTFKDDQDRRDFTINAMAISLNKADYGKMHDPFAGIKDIENKIIRTPLEPLTTFIDDPLRMMRAIRFAAQLNFKIEEKTLAAITKDAERIRIVSQERITDELNKIIATDKPSVGFDLLYTTGLLKLIFPQMVELAGAEYKDGHGHKDNFYHTLQVLDNLAPNSDDLWLRWAAVLHDIAKPVTKRFEEGTGWTFHGHEVVGGR